VTTKQDIYPPKSNLQNYYAKIIDSSSSKPDWVKQKVFQNSNHEDEQEIIRIKCKLSYLSLSSQLRRIILF